ncbi:MAG TPA: hypothetical protein VHP37_15805 [Burkholderiales bacterium]|nr:hypothetical protein [Burkholderiales bacterium]
MTEHEVRRARRRRRSACGLLALCLFLAMLPPVASAATILIEPRVGFHGVFQLGRPFPLEVGLENIGASTEGILEIGVWKGGPEQGGAAYQAFHRREVFLPARSRRSVELTVDPDVLNRPLEIRFTGASASASRAVDLRRHFTPAPVVLSLSEGSAIPLTSLGASLTNRVVAVGVAELPRDARALRGVSHLVVYDLSLRDLSRTQSLALEHWLAAGGRMVIIGSLNYTLYQAPQLARFLPVRVHGVKRTAFTAHVGADPFDAIGGVWTQTATLVKGRLVSEAEGLPLIVESDWGRGKVAYLAVDAGRPPLSTWNGLPRFLQDLLATRPVESASLETQWTDSIFSQALLSPWFVSTYLPGRSLFFAIAGYLAGLIVLVRLWRRWRMTPRKLILACCGWIGCTAVAGYLYFSRGERSPEGVLLTASVMEDAGGGYVDAQSNLALFSTRPHDYSLAFGQAWVDAVPRLRTAAAQPAPSLVYRHGAGTTRVEVPLKAWDYKLLRARHVERLQLAAAIVQTQGELVLDVLNQSGKDLTDCWLVAPGLHVALGNLPAGERWKKSFALPDAAADPARRTEQSLREIRFNDKPRDVLFQASFFPEGGTQSFSRNGAALFVGWLREPEPRFETGEARVRVQSYALYRAIAPLAGPEDE